MLVLITGFGPFPGAPLNPSGMLAKALARRRRPAFAALDRTVHVFATRYSSVDRELPKLMARKPDIVLMFGVAGRRHELGVETQARNAMSLLFPDASRHRPQQGTIKKGAPAVLKGNAPFPTLLSAAKTRLAASRLSHDAGRYMCNYVFWRALEYAQGGAPLIPFVHIPMVSSKPRRKKPGRRRPPALAELLNGAEALLIALMAASRH